MTAERFPDLLNRLRTRANLTIRQLGELADVPHSFIASVQTGQRNIGEIQAQRLGQALGLSGSDLREFVLKALDTCSAKVLTEAMEYPAPLLNWLPAHLRSQGIMPHQLAEVTFEDARGRMKLMLTDGSFALVETQLVPC